MTDWWRDPAQLQAAVKKYGTPTQAAREMGGVSHSTVLIAWRNLKAGKQIPLSVQDAARARSSASVKDAESAPLGIEVEVTPDQIRWSSNDLAEFHGLDPELNIVTRRVAKRWNAALGEGRVAEMNGLAVTFEARYPADTILPARSDGWVPPKRIPRQPTMGKRTLAVSTDWHAPYEDQGLFDCYLQVLERYQPDEDWDLGDLVDYPQPSRHRMTKGFEATPQQCVDERYKHDAARVKAAPNAIHRRKYGNHDVRVDIAVTEKVGAHVARLARAGDTLPVLDLGNLLRYDELGIEVLRPDGDYHSVVSKLAEGLNARHGTKSGPYGGAVKTMSRRTASQLSGHDHTQMIMQRTSYDDNDMPVMTLSASIGCGCQRELGRSYAEDADVHLGFAWVTDHGGGSFNVELARYDDARRELYFRENVYRPRAGI